VALGKASVLGCAAIMTKPDLDPPPMLYGTAWKEERTHGLTAQALAAGFRGIDTANQRRHYFEAAVGQAVKDAIADQVVTRAELFLQSKYTYVQGQDHRLPYDRDADHPTQVRQSMKSTLEHFDTDYLDAYLLHGPSLRAALSDVDWEVWHTMEALAREGATRSIGISNVSLPQLLALVKGADVKPAFVQNRCFARDGWDHDVRALCREHGVVYQGFSFLTANGRELGSAAVSDVARRAGYTLPQVVFRFAAQIGMLPLTGTSNEAHMRQDLAAVRGAPLSDDDMRTIERIAS
jgi:diketogulonate reductase-like aldo/keto reductase